jgi:hypothetical protein
VIALLDAFAELLRGRDREAHLDLPAFELPGDLEARIPEDREHRVVLGEHYCEESLDALLCRAWRELLEEARGRAASLQLVGDGEGDLRGRAIAQSGPLGERDDPLAAVLAGDGADEAPRSVQSGSRTCAMNAASIRRVPWKRW